MYLSECNSPATTARWAATLPPPPPRSPMASSLNFETLSTKVLSSRKNYLWPITAQFYSFEKVLAFLGTSGVGHLRVEIDENMRGSAGGKVKAQPRPLNEDRWRERGYRPFNQAKTLPTSPHHIWIQKDEAISRCP